MRRTWVFGAAMAAAVGLAGCGGNPANRQTPAELAATKPSPTATALPPAAGDQQKLLSGDVSAPGGGRPASGSSAAIYPQFPAGPLTSVSRRIAGSVTLRLFTTAPVAGPTCDPYTSQCVPVWCQPTSQLSLELSTDTIAAREITENIGVGPGSHLSVLNSATEGISEGQPVQVFVAKVASDVDHVQLAIGPTTDVTSPKDGLVALAVSDQAAAGTVTAYGAAGEVLQQLNVPTGPSQDGSTCQPQPIKLPTPGEQPTDRPAAVSQVRAAFANAFTHAPADGDIYHGLATVQDGSGLRNAVDQVRRNFPTAFDTITETTGDIVFTDPAHAVVQFTATYAQGAPYGKQNGTAVLAGGKWLVSQATYCGLLRFGGATCP